MKFKLNNMKKYLYSILKKIKVDFIKSYIRNTKEKIKYKLKINLLQVKLSDYKGKLKFELRKKKNSIKNKFFFFKEKYSLNNIKIIVHKFILKTISWIKLKINIKKIIAKIDQYSIVMAKNGFWFVFHLRFDLFYDYKLLETQRSKDAKRWDMVRGTEDARIVRKWSRYYLGIVLICAIIDHFIPGQIFSLLGIGNMMLEYHWLFILATPLSKLTLFLLYTRRFILHYKYGVIGINMYSASINKKNHPYLHQFFYLTTYTLSLLILYFIPGPAEFINIFQEVGYANYTVPSLKSCIAFFKYVFR